MNIGIIGSGAIGSYLAETIIAGAIPRVTLKAVLDQKVELIPTYITDAGVAGLESLDEFLALDLDLVVEAASQGAMAKLVPTVVERGISCLIMSVGALQDPELYDRIERAAVDTKAQVYIPSGAIGGLDLVRAAKMAGITGITLETRKSPRSLGREEIPSGPQVLFSGPAREAVKRFPKNVNVAAALSLAGIGFDQTQVQVVVDPSVSNNQHHIKLHGPFGEVEVKVSNKPSPANPKTSLLAPLSALALLAKLSSPIQIG